MLRLLLLIAMLSWTGLARIEAQLPTGWKAHDLNRPLPKVVDPGPTDSSAPSDAIVLFDGSDLSKWTDGKGGEPKWKVVDGAMESVPGSGYVFTKEKFGDCQLHVEWASPSKVKGNGQGRGNSGVYLMGQFEVQVLDSFENSTYADGSAGSLYGQYPPLVNASRKPGQWQSYDIVFRAPKFSQSGELETPARMTVFHNGVLIQDHSELFGPTNWIQHKNYRQSESKLPLSLQDHGNPVRYRNIWLRPLSPTRGRPETPYATETSTVELDKQTVENLIGKYGRQQIELRGDRLYLIFQGQPLEMIALSKSKFGFRKSAGEVEFFSDADGKIMSMELRLDATGPRKFERSGE